MAEDLGEKTEQPTARKLNEARERGQLPKSSDLSAAIVMIGATVAMILFGGSVLGGAGVYMRHTLDVMLPADLVGRRVQTDMTLTFDQIVRLLVPLMLLMLLVAYIAQVVQVGFMFTVKPLEPKLSKLNPIAGAKKFFSRRSLIKGGMDTLKLAVIGAVVTLVISLHWTEVLGLASLPILLAVKEMAILMLKVAIVALAVLIVLGLLDFIYQKWQTTEDLKMSKHEVKDERKSSEGDADVKARRLRMARQIAMQRLQRDVPEADVIVTNPTHFAVALKYDADRMGAPRVVAKGADYLALRIRYIAAAHGVPIVERPPLARALYAQVKIGREVPVEHYEAVAEVLAYVYRLEERLAS